MKTEEIDKISSINLNDAGAKNPATVWAEEAAREAKSAKEAAQH